MREILPSRIFDAIYTAICDISYHSDPLLVQAIEQASQIEQDERVADVLDAILQNNQLSPLDQIPLCQDTGSTIVFAEIGSELIIPGDTLQEIANAAAAKAQAQCPLRASIVSEPLFARQNTANNSPAIVHITQVPGDTLNLRIAQKGGGAENMSFLIMLSPTTPIEQIKSLLVERIIATGSNACPPLIVGIGIGGNFERSAYLAKAALLEPLGRKHPHPQYAKLEAEILSELNLSGPGAQGMGGSLSAIAVQILYEACHIASLPIAVNLQCHAHRHTNINL